MHYKDRDVYEIHVLIHLDVICIYDLVKCLIYILYLNSRNSLKHLAKYHWDGEIVPSEQCKKAK